MPKKPGLHGQPCLVSGVLPFGHLLGHLPGTRLTPLLNRHHHLVEDDFEVLQVPIALPKFEAVVHIAFLHRLEGPLHEDQRSRYPIGREDSEPDRREGEYRYSSGEEDHTSPYDASGTRPPAIMPTLMIGAVNTTRKTQTAENGNTDARVCLNPLPQNFMALVVASPLVW
jgi:hypothetical protein